MKGSGNQVSETTPLVADQTRLPILSAETQPQSSSPDVECQVPRADNVEPSRKNSNEFRGILALLLIGTFVANADTSLVLATYGQISSEFQRLQDAPWLLSSYMLSMCASQPLYGKLSNIYGRKPLLLAAYVLFATGCLICGLANRMSVVIVGRLISGIGGAGMSSVVSFLISDLVPLREIATYRSYVNIVTTVGRSCGGPIGGWLAETMGWRSSFLVQCPLTVLAIVLVGWKLNVSRPTFKSGDEGETAASKFYRIDFLGAFVMCSMIVTFLLPLSMVGNQLAWSHPLIPGLFGISAFLGLMFALVESKVAKEPIFPLSLLRRRDVIIPYCVLFLQNVAQTLMMYAVPLYFQVTQSATPSTAGFYLIPAVVGNTVGGLATGSYIKRYGRYKLPTLLAAASSAVCHALLIARWNGHTNPAESLHVFPGGIGTGIAHSSTFIAITAGTTDEELAIAGSGLYLCGGFGSVFGVTLSSSVIRTVTEHAAKAALPERLDVVEKALTDVRFVESLTGTVRRLIVHSYVMGFSVNFGLALVACIFSGIATLFLREKRLD